MNEILPQHNHEYFQHLVDLRECFMCGETQKKSSTGEWIEFNPPQKNWTMVVVFILGFGMMILIFTGVIK